MDQWKWESADAARSYLRDLGRLWTVWALALGGMFTTRGTVLIVLSLGAFVVLVMLSLPVQKHVDSVTPPQDERSRLAKLRGGNERDHASRQLLYALGPIRAAAEMTGGSGVWVWARHGIVGGTLAAFLWVAIYG